MSAKAPGLRRGSFVRTPVAGGTWRVMVFLDSPTGQQMKRPTLGMEETSSTTEAFLNGQPLGEAWKGRRRLHCGAALLPGRNQLRVGVANLWIHDTVSRLAPDLRELEETFGIRWGRYGEVPPETVPPAGLLGPVRLLPFRRVVVRIP